MPARLSLGAVVVGITTLGAAALTSAPQGPSVQPPATYAEALRPQFHFSPAASFTNDPNGLVYYKGRYHLFYQQRVFVGATGLSCCDWGHAVSRDLVRWEQRPVAIHRVPASETTPVEAIFSGSAVVDWKNTSGFGSRGNPPLVAIYTGARPGSQTQQLAYSLDEGETWQIYSGNPVVDIKSGAFRDPKVFWYEPLRRWTMVVYSSTGTRFYSSPDLKVWTYQSAFGSGFECPDFFPLAVDGNAARQKWVLFEANGSYWVGDFDGARFTPDTPEVTGRMDYGTNYYAAQTFSDIPGRRILIGWISTGFVRNGIWPELPWMGAMSVARELGLQTVDGKPQIVAKPVRELDTLRSNVVRVTNLNAAADSAVPLAGVHGDQLDIEVTIVPGSSATSGLRVLAGEGLYTEIGYDVRANEVYIDRSRSGRQDGLGGNGWSGRAPRPEQARGKALTLRVLVDRSTLEVYADGGLRVLSANVLPLVHTTTTSVSNAGTTTLLVQRTTGFVVGQTLRVNADANGPLAGMQDYKVAAVGTGVIDSTLAAPVVPGDRNLKLANVNNFVPGGIVTIGSGPGAERIAVAPAGVGTATSPPTIVFADVPAGATNIKAGSVAGFASGASIVIGSEGGQETATVASVGTRGRDTTLAVETASGDGTVKAASIMGLAVGGPVVIGAGTANAETRTITGPVGSDGAFNGTAGPQGTGVTLSVPLSIAHAAGATLRFLGTGITLASPLTRPHLSGAAISLPGTGVTLAAPVKMAHAIGEPVADPGTGLTASPALTVTWPRGTPVRTAPQTAVEFFATGGSATITSAHVWRMKSIWSAEPAVARHERPRAN